MHGRIDVAMSGMFLGGMEEPTGVVQCSAADSVTNLWLLEVTFRDRIYHHVYLRTVKESV
jgi:hypothetical protein